MKIITFSRRCGKEILRDPLNLFFGLGFPIVLLLLLEAIQKNVPVDLFAINRLTPGITVFGLSFMTLFSATLVSRDRESAFLERLYTTPMSSGDFIFGYMLPIIPLSVGQCIVCYIAAIPLGLKPGIGIVYSVLFIVPIAILYISLGFLCGSVFTVKQVGGICGALLTNLSAWLSGTWFDLDLVGGAFRQVANLLPFIHAVELERAVLDGRWSDMIPHLLWVIAWGTFVTAVAVLLFLRQMRKK